MVNVNSLGLPLQLLALGVTDKLAVTADVPVLLAVNAAMFPRPLAPKPMLVVLFVQL